jgi:hypothetical protein
LARLEKLAHEVSDLVEYRVEPLQVAAVLIERDLEHMSEEELVEAVASAGPRRSA